MKRKHLAAGIAVAAIVILLAMSLLLVTRQSVTWSQNQILWERTESGNSVTYMVTRSDIGTLKGPFLLGTSYWPWGAGVNKRIWLSSPGVPEGYEVTSSTFQITCAGNQFAHYTPNKIKLSPDRESIEVYIPSASEAGFSEALFNSNPGCSASGSIHFESSKPIPEPSEPTDLGSIFQAIIDTILGWLNNLFTVFSVAQDAPETLSPGDTFTASITLTNTHAEVLPDSDYSDGMRSWLYTGVLVTKGSDIQSQETHAVEDAVQPGGTVSQNVEYIIPWDAEEGEYAAAAVLFSVEKAYNFQSGEWEDKDHTVIDKQSVNFEVAKGVPEPEAPSEPGNIFADLINGILNWIRSLFGWLGL